jgi:carbon-monoxide dehydrogenase small subunit
LEGVLDTALAERMLNWRHSGFSVHDRVRSKDTAGPEPLPDQAETTPGRWLTDSFFVPRDIQTRNNFLSFILHSEGRQCPETGVTAKIEYNERANEGIIMKEVIRFTLNGKPVKLDAEPDRPLLWALRGDLNLTGTKYGCGVGLCGACAVLVGGVAKRSCLLVISDISNKTVTTVEGLANGDELHPVQQAFIDHDALQCGYCTPGMIITSVGLLAEKPAASETDIVARLDGNLCRCGAHKRILEAVRSVARSAKP